MTGAGKSVIDVVGMLLLVLSIALFVLFLAEVGVDLLNLRALSVDAPVGLREYFDTARYRRSQEYLRVNTRFGFVQGALNLAALLVFLWVGGLNWWDHIVRLLGLDPIASGVLFVGGLGLAMGLFRLPFAAYHTFVIEERFGFNRTRICTFLADVVRAALLSALLGSPLAAGVFWLFEYAGEFAWTYAWIAVSVFELFLAWVAPVWLLPVFNKLTPLSFGELRTAIENYCESQHFAMSGVYTMDGSRRSGKTNAFFTGFGHSRRIVLFDTLIEKHSVSELVAILAHEVGHYRCGHIWKQLVVSMMLGGVIFAVAGHVIGEPWLFGAFGVDQPSVYVGILLVGLLYIPVSRVLAFASNWVSRRNEFEADEFSARTFVFPGALANGLKKLASDNLANLSPHPVKVAWEYTHPPIVDRVKRLENREWHATKGSGSSG